jgi:hypothetical protein
MGKSLRLILLLILILIPIIFYNSLNKKGKEEFLLEEAKEYTKPKVALIFDNLGGSLKDLKEIYTLNIPLSISVIPGFKFSRNIAYIGYRCGFSVLIHLPLEADDFFSFKKYKYRPISNTLSRREIDSLLRYYLNFIRIAMGVNIHLNKKIENPSFWKQILKAIKRKKMIIIDSSTDSTLCICCLAKKEDLLCASTEGFLNSQTSLEEKLEELIKRAEDKGKIIIIVYPRKDILKILKQKIPSIEERVKFVNLRDYFGL